MEPGGPLPHSQLPTTRPNPEADQSSSIPHSTLEGPLILSSHLRLGFQTDLFSSGFPTKILYAPVRPPYLLHALPISTFWFYHLNFKLINTILWVALHALLIEYYSRDCIKKNEMGRACGTYGEMWGD